LILYLLCSSTGNSKLHININSDYEQARSQAIFLEMLAKQGRCHEAFFGLGRGFVQAGEYRRARQYLQEAVRLCSGDGAYYCWLGVACLY
jgi:Flp pilus assembly protein TadD